MVKEEATISIDTTNNTYINNKAQVAEVYNNILYELNPSNNKKSSARRKKFFKVIITIIDGLIMICYTHVLA